MVVQYIPISETWFLERLQTLFYYASMVATNDSDDKYISL